MRRTITTLMILAICGLANAVHGADNGGKADWQYYAAGASSYRISDDDDGPAGQTGVAHAGGSAQAAGKEQNALYVAEGTGLSGEVLQTSFFDNGGCNSCGCGQCGCLSNCCNCDCSTTMVRLEWLGWFTRGRNTPPLVTTSPVGTPLATAGVLGFNTQTLYGDDPIGRGLRNGGRFTLSHLMGDGLTTATLRFWGVEDSSETFVANSPPLGILAVPFHALQGNINQEDARLIAYPGVAEPGSIRVLSKNDLIGLDAWGSRNWYNDGGLSIDVLGGYQFARLDDSLSINTLSTAGVLPGSGFNPGDVFSFSDSFRTKNEFHGGSLGFLARSYKGAITLEGLFKMGLGNMHQTVTVAGNTTVNGTVVNPAGGILTSPTNIGTQVHDHFNFVPEVNANLLYNINSNWRAIVGYSFIYWNNVVLAGNQIDRNVNNSGGVLPPAVPSPKFQRTDFWIQGVSLGADYRW